MIVLTGQRTSTWIEREPWIDGSGKIALQIHGDCRAEISFRNLSIEALPDPIVPPQGRDPAPIRAGAAVGSAGSI